MNEPPAIERKRAQFDLTALFLLVAAAGCYVWYVGRLFPEAPLEARVRPAVQILFMVSILGMSAAVLLRKRARPVRTFFCTIIAFVALVPMIHYVRAWLHQ